MEDNMKLVISFKYSGLLIKGASETIENKGIKQMMLQEYNNMRNSKKIVKGYKQDWYSKKTLQHKINLYFIKCSKFPNDNGIKKQC